MLLNILLTLHILICIALIGVILLQRSEGGAFGVGGGGNSFMTARGAGDLLTRTTAILAGLFFLLSLVLTLLSGRGAGSVTDNLDINAVAPRSAPATAPPIICCRLRRLPPTRWPVCRRLRPNRRRRRTANSLFRS
jgi:preprotein translocase subunit SecG